MQCLPFRFFAKFRDLKFSKYFIGMSLSVPVVYENFISKKNDNT